ncbi:MAG: glycerophosphodiester phosphodiesterase [Desulfobacteraceae bacterium]|nr:glycerophosphodiester phosphodiesterase [Desulfobacteraceae bacterium]
MGRKFFSFVISLIVINLIVIGPPALCIGQSSFLDCPCPQILAHRGDSGNYPESTEPAFTSALEKGTDILELDVHLSFDDEIIVSHDADTSVVTGDTRKIEDMTLEQIKELDAGYTFTLDEQTYPYRGIGLKILTLQEIIDYYPDVRISIELKDNSKLLAQKTWELIQLNKIEDIVLVASQHTKAMNEYRSLSNHATLTGGTIEEISRASIAWAFGFGWTINPEYDVVHLPAKIITQPFVNFFQSRGITVHPWTVNQTSKMHSLLDDEVDGIIGDYPERIYQVYEERGLR